MNKIRVSAKEIAELQNSDEVFVRIMLREKGLPMSGTFYPQLMLNEYRYSVFDDHETGDTVYTYEKI